MTIFQKWLLILAAFIVAGSFAYYLLVYVPGNKKAEIRKQAGIECKKRADKATETITEIPPKTQEGLQNQLKLIIQLHSDEGTEKCINKVLEEWGYK